MENFSNTEQELIKQKIRALEIAGDWIPGIKIIQTLNPFQNLFICDRGIKQFMINRTFFEHISSIEFGEKIFDAKEPDTCLVGTKNSNEPNVVSKKIYIRHANMDPKNELDVVIVEDLFPDISGAPRLRIFQIIPINIEPWAVPKTRKIVEEVSFQKANHKKFSNLTHRNREVLSLWAQSLKAEEIGEKLFIGVNSVNSHKKRIKELLDTSNSAEIIKFGQAFDLF